MTYIIGQQKEPEPPDQCEHEWGTRMTVTPEGNFENQVCMKCKKVKPIVTAVHSFKFTKVKFTIRDKYGQIKEVRDRDFN